MIKKENSSNISKKNMKIYKIKSVEKIKDNIINKSFTKKNTIKKIFILNNNTNDKSFFIKSPIFAERSLKLSNENKIISPEKNINKNSAKSKTENSKKKSKIFNLASKIKNKADTNQKVDKNKNNENQSAKEEDIFDYINFNDAICYNISFIYNENKNINGPIEELDEESEKSKPSQKQKNLKVKIDKYLTFKKNNNKKYNKINIITKYPISKIIKSNLKNVNIKNKVSLPTSININDNNKSRCSTSEVDKKEKSTKINFSNKKNKSFKKPNIFLHKSEIKKNRIIIKKYNSKNFKTNNNKTLTNKKNYCLSLETSGK